ncbi:uncharacterized protein LOC126252082 isoform X1 [Schistocerca nitens]|uniref:uncharacterized protein LOC126252082 isoform X1 n=1 Tax=Schistocerca nitens TaxID=7011 RepID=UPI0021175FF5|nr:uncharacterized protein LOC126252082 isoform X1 [Schistocerca nitens]
MLVLYHTLLQAFQYYQTISMGSFSIQKVVYYFKFWQGEIVRVPASGSDKEQILIPLKEFMKKQDELTKKDEMIDALQKKIHRSQGQHSHSTHQRVSSQHHGLSPWRRSLSLFHLLSFYRWSWTCPRCSS